MTRRAKWIAVASLFTAINIGGAIYAMGMNERPHAGIHVVLTLVGLWWMWRLLAKARPAVQQLSVEDERLQELQQSVDAIAVEVERIGEAQRFTAKKVAEQVQQEPPKRDR